jgi:LacI family transcriptional regulator
LREANYVIPKDVSVISYDNIPQMANLEVPLTSFGVPVDQIANYIVTTLMDFIQDRDSVPYVQTLQPAINELNSCAHAAVSFMESNKPSE